MSEKFEQKRRDFRKAAEQVADKRGHGDLERLIDAAVRYGLSMDEMIVVLCAETER